jgi:hypothetical protein
MANEVDLEIECVEKQRLSNQRESNQRGLTAQANTTSTTAHPLCGHALDAGKGGPTLYPRSLRDLRQGFSPYRRHKHNAPAVRVSRNRALWSDLSR